MSAKKPQSYHGKALAAFQGGWITAHEYRLCLLEKAWVSGRAIWLENGHWGWIPHMFHFRGKVRNQKGIAQ